MSDVVLFGHSFIDHLRRYVCQDVSRYNLGLDPTQFNVRFHGLSGLSLRQQQRLRVEEPSVQGAAIVFLDIETNDLSAEAYVPETFARDLCSYAQYLQIGLNVHTVIVGQILFRGVLSFDFIFS